MTRKNKTNSASFERDRRLLPGEKIAFKATRGIQRASDEDLNRRYVKGDVRIVTEAARYSLAGILSMLQETVSVDGGVTRELRYKLDPEYQRRHRWSNERKSRLIESFLMNVPVPPVFLYERDLARFEVMDGRQRLTALAQFYDNEFPLQGLQYWPELNGRTYANLPSKVRDGIDRRYISSIILLKETASDEEQAAQLKKMVFERLNSGGVALSAQETRNAVYDGPLNRLCLQLSNNPHYRAMWRLPNEVPDYIEDREDSESQDHSTKTGERMFGQMEDVELVLRFFAYRQIDAFPGGLNKSQAFLDRFLVEGNKFEPDILHSYEVMFESALKFLWTILEQAAFCRLTAAGRASGRPTKSVYDPMMYAVNRLSSDDRALLAGARETVVGHLAKMHTEAAALFAGRRTNTADAQHRNTRVELAFKNAISAVRG